MNWKKFRRFIAVTMVIVVVLLIYFNVIFKSSGTYDETDKTVCVAPFVNIVGSGDIYIITGDGDAKTTRKERLEFPFFTLSPTGTDIIVESGNITLNP